MGYHRCLSSIGSGFESRWEDVGSGSVRIKTVMRAQKIGFKAPDALVALQPKIPSISSGGEYEMTVGTLVLNADMSVLTYVSWQRAVTKILAGEAEIHEADPQRTIRSKHVEVPFPRVIRLVKWVYIKWTGRKSNGAVCTKRGVLERDRFTCGYCGGKGDTIDHIHPESRGGKLTWENSISACSPCNNEKADRTPEEWGKRLLWEPWRPDLLGMEQRRVWASLEKLETMSDDEFL